MDNRKIPERKEKDDHDSWMYDLDLNDVIKKFAATQGDSENIGYYLIDNIRGVKRRSYYKEISQIF